MTDDKRTTPRLIGGNPAPRRFFPLNIQTCPLVGKEQARKNAKSQNCRFVILSNGDLHYFWDLERGNRYIITTFPSPTSVARYQQSAPDAKRPIEDVLLAQRPRETLN